MKKAKEPLKIKTNGLYIRKRDKTLVKVLKRTRVAIEYMTYPLLVVWYSKPESFARGFRDATPDEAKYADA